MNDVYYANQRPEIVPFLPERRRSVLEIGCGFGNFSGNLPGVEETWGIEPHAPAAEAASARLSRVINSTFDMAMASLPKRHFDLVICNDVIEHMPDHVAFLRQIKEFIAPGGCLVGSIPNVRYYQNLFELLFEKDWHYRQWGILDRTHLRFFTEKSLRRAFQANGYRIDRMEGINPVVDTSSTRAKLYAGLARILIPLSGGYYDDIRFLQFGFRVTPAG